MTAVDLNVVLQILNLSPELLVLRVQARIIATLFGPLVAATADGKLGGEASPLGLGLAVLGLELHELRHVALQQVLSLFGTEVLELAQVLEAARRNGQAPLVSLDAVR